jgi:hypothetical protein
MELCLNALIQTDRGSKGLLAQSYFESWFYNIPADMCSMKNMERL